MRRKCINENRMTDFCTTCRKITKYTMQKRNIVKNIKAHEYIFSFTTAVCDECGEKMGIPGLIDRNIQEFEEQYKVYEKTISDDMSVTE